MNKNIVSFNDWEPAEPLRAGDMITMTTSSNAKWDIFLKWLINKPLPITNKEYMVLNNG